MTEPGKNEAIEYLQTAAIEAIKAMRTFLDVAEGLVREPETAAMVGKAFAEAAASAMRPTRASADDDMRDDEDNDERVEEKEPTGGVRRINLSD